MHKALLRVEEFEGQHEEFPRCDFRVQNLFTKSRFDNSEHDRFTYYHIYQDQDEEVVRPKMRRESSVRRRTLSNTRTALTPRSMTPKGMWKSTSHSILMEHPSNKSAWEATLRKGMDFDLD